MTQSVPVALTVARDLSLKMLERRSLSAGNLAEALKTLYQTGQEVVQKSSACPGLPLLRLAASVTLAQIEKDRLGKAEAVTESLKINAEFILNAISTVPPTKAKIILPHVQALILKMLETNALSSANLSSMIEELTGAMAALI
ncbi:MAG: hypothetical protein LBP22_13300 [Deltaproteobacteria bacterium]|jgi:hypothetical protein|nr:hypothetical protein [Deltaproteobacteria bacterium]